MAIFNSYVKLPEGIFWCQQTNLKLHTSPLKTSRKVVQQAFQAAVAMESRGSARRICGEQNWRRESELGAFSKSNIIKIITYTYQ